jgi:hypothetical protein
MALNIEGVKRKLYFKCNLWDWISMLKLNMTCIMIINNFFHDNLDYSQMYTFGFNHDYKFWTFWTIKNVPNQN